MKKISTFILGTLLLLLSLSGCAINQPEEEFDKDAPVYTGMNILNDIGLSKKDLKENELTNDIGELKTFETINDDIGDYFKMNEKFCIEIHFSNPESYEIQSLTLNGTKYLGYMFKEGSTMERLIVEATAPNTPGRFSYLIDNIKYVNGEIIKNARMSGNRTIDIGVEYPNAPKASISNIKLFPTKNDFEVNISDNDSLIRDELSLYLSDGKSIIYSTPLNIGLNKIHLDNLYDGSIYQFGVFATFDKYNGLDFHGEWLIKHVFTTPTIFNITNVVPSQNKVNFTIHKNGEEGEIKKIILHDNFLNTDLSIENFDIVEINNLFSNREYTLIVDYEYLINDSLISASISHTFSTNKKSAPTLLNTTYNPTKESINYKIDIKDKDDTISSYKLELFDGEELVAKEEELFEGTFANLLSNHSYYLRLTYSYNLNDGVGDSEVIKGKTIKTLSKDAPSLKLSKPSKELIFDNVGNVAGLSNDPADGILYINTPINDYAFRNTTFNIETVVLDEGCTLIGNAAFYQAYSVKNVIINTNVFPKLVNDTFGCIWGDEGLTIYVFDEIYNQVKSDPTNDRYWQEFGAQCVRKFSEMPDALQSILYSQVSGTFTTIEYDLELDDPDNVVTSCCINLFDGDVLVASNTESTKGIFDNLISNHIYKLELIYSFDLNDGNGSITLSKSINVKTKMKAIPNFSFGKASTELVCDIYGNVTGISKDPFDGVLYIDSPIKGSAFKKTGHNIETVVINEGCTLIGQEAFYQAYSVKNVIINTSVFPELVKDTFGYIWGDAGLRIYVFDEIYDQVKSDPTNDVFWSQSGSQCVHKFSEMPDSLLFNISSQIDSTNETIEYDLKMTDPDDAIASYNVELFDGKDLIASNDESTKGIFNNLASNHIYTIRLTYSYDLLDGNGLVTITRDTNVKTKK